MAYGGEPVDDVDELLDSDPRDLPPDTSLLLRNIPPFLNRTEIFYELESVPPPRADGFETASDIERMRRANDVRAVVTPFEQGIGAFNRLQLLLSASYECRSKVEGGMLTQVFNHALRADAQLTATHDGLRSEVKTLRPLVGGGARGMMLAGPTGVGKSVLLDRFERYFNREVRRGRGRLRINGGDSWPQVPVLRVQCVANGTLVGIATAILHALDALADTRFSAGISRLTRDTFETRLHAALSSCFVGLLIIEDIHHLKDSALNRKALLRFLANLMEFSGVAVVLVGTCRAEEVIESVASLQAKLTSDGTVRFRRLKNDVQFQTLFMSYWAQRVSHFELDTPPDGVMERVYFHTQGLPRIIWQLTYQMFLRMVEVEGTTLDNLDIAFVDGVADSAVPARTREGMYVFRCLAAGMPVDEKTLNELEEYLFLDELDELTESTERKYALSTADYVKRFNADMEVHRRRKGQEQKHKQNFAGRSSDDKGGTSRGREGTQPAAPAKRGRGRPRKTAPPEPTHVTEAAAFNPTNL